MHLKKKYLDNKIILNIFFLFILFKLIQIFHFRILPPIDHPFGIWQVLNKDLFLQDLLGTVLYLHSQPFLWNLFIGTLTKFFYGNIFYIQNFLHIYNLLLTFGIIYYSAKISEFYKLSKNKIYLITLFILFNPTIIFWESMLYYYHTVTFVIFQISYLLVLFFKKYNVKYEIYIYINLTLLIFIWSAFHSILILLFFIVRNFGYKSSKISVFFFLFFLFLSYIPNIKNKLIFGTSNSSWLGQQIAITVNTIQPVGPCALGPIEYNESNLINYYKYYNPKKILNHPSLIGKLSERNYLGNFYLSQLCFDRSIDAIKKNPKIYFKGLFEEFVSIHGKTLIDHSIYYNMPRGWDNVDYLVRYVNFNYKSQKQVVNIIFMLALYSYFFYKIFFSKIPINKNLSFISIFAIYSYILLIGVIFSKYEGERFIYAGYVIFLLAIIDFLSEKRS
jgi:hypothetical protein